MSETSTPETSLTLSKGKHSGGRPTKRTPEVTRIIGEALSFGLTDADAAALAGINENTLAAWYRIPEFSRVVKTAIVSRKLIRLQRIDSGTEGWQGTAWCMERQYPQEWSRPELRVNVEHSGAVEHQIRLVAETDLRRMSEIRAEIEAEVMAA